MTLSEGADIVAMAILPKGVAPDGASDEEDEEEASPSASSGAGEDEEAGSSGDTMAAAGPCLLVVTEQGLGKRTPISGFKLTRSRTGKGVKALRLNPGDRLAAAQVVEDGSGAAGGAAISSTDDDAAPRVSDVLLSTQQGQLVRVPITSIRVIGRTAKGQRVVKVREGDVVVAATVLSKQL